MTIAEQFPKRSFVIGEDFEGRVKATTDKFGGRVLVEVAWKDDPIWVTASTLRVMADDDRSLDCEGCQGTGRFYSGGMVLNGKFTGKIGPCFRCEGKGKQTPKDRSRNSYYDNNVRRFSV